MKTSASFRVSAVGKYVMLLLVTATIVVSSVAQQSNEPQLLRISEDNDYLNFRGEGTDRGYSSGFDADLFYTRTVRPKLAGRLLIPLRDKAFNIYSWGFTHQIYTPSEMGSPEIQYGQRPYAGVAYVSHALTSIDAVRQQSLTSSVSLGVIGKYSFAEQIQNTYHNLVDHPVAKGWHNQVATDVIFNYFVKYEHMLVDPNSNLEVIGDVQVNTGTLHNNVGLGVHLRCGLFNPYFSEYRLPAFNSTKPSTRKFQLYFFMKVAGVTVMDNATLQGGFFTHQSSPYTIKKDSVNRFYMAYEYGLVLSGRKFGISASEKIRTPEFAGSFSHQIGNIILFFAL